LPVAFLQEVDEAIWFHQAYPIFEVKDSKELDPEYLMMWFRRPEFDRMLVLNARQCKRWFDWEEIENFTHSPPRQTTRNSKRIQHHTKPHSPKPTTDTKTGRNRTGDL
jgi:hypothetical protein